MVRELKFYESDWASNLKKVSLTDAANNFFKDKNVEYVDMKIDSIYDSNNELYQTIVIAYYDLDEIEEPIDI